jgi:hypothetical protein
MVDGLGGENWDGAILICDLLERWFSTVTEFPNTLHIHEVGAGAGLIGLLCSHLTSNLSVILSDRESDLCLKNSKECKVYPSISSAITGVDPITHSSSYLNSVRAMDLNWGITGYDQCDKIENKPHLLIGAEIAVLFKQQPLLCETIDRLSDDKTIVMLSIDGLPIAASQPLTEEEKVIELEKTLKQGKDKKGPITRIPYLTQLDRDLLSRGFQVKASPAKAVVWKKVVADVDQINTNTEPDTSGFSHVYTFSDRIAALETNENAKNVDSKTGSPMIAELIDVNNNVTFESQGLDELCVHHIRCYYRPGLLDIADEDHPLLSIPIISSFFREG